ncbi:MAG: HEXXH motif-containing putative peptide modification protein [Kofleriaceae bacterium]
MRLSSTQRDLEPTPAVVAGAPPPLASAAASTGRFRELLHLFEWRDPAWHRHTCATLERNHLEAVAARVNRLLPDDVRAELDALSDDSYLSLLRAPEVFHAAFYGPRDRLAASMQTWIAVERAALAAPTSLRGAVPAATLDRVVTAADGVVTNIEPLTRVAAGPALDTTSDLPGRLVTRFPDRMLVRPIEQERRAVVAKLEAAFALLPRVSPLADGLVRAMTQVICARTAVEDARFYTASDASTLGVIHLTNAHLDRKTPAQVASELVHEAIHQALFRWELQHALLARPEAATAKVTSPWTGAKLDLYAYVHACFVWYGVANLWRQGGAPDDLSVVRQRRAAEVGFQHDPLARLGPHADALSPALQATLTAMAAALA